MSDWKLPDATIHVSLNDEQRESLEGRIYAVVPTIETGQPFTLVPLSDKEQVENAEAVIVTEEAGIFKPTDTATLLPSGVLLSPEYAVSINENSGEVEIKAHGAGISSFIGTQASTLKNRLDEHDQKIYNQPVALESLSQTEPELYSSIRNRDVPPKDAIAAEQKEPSELESAINSVRDSLDSIVEFGKDATLSLPNIINSDSKHR